MSREVNASMYGPVSPWFVGGKDMPCGAVESGSVRHMTSNDKGSRGIVLTAHSEWLSNPSPGAHHQGVCESASLCMCV